jgi:ATP-binding cassette subfamily F protein 3
MADEHAVEFNGDVDDYLQWLASRRQAATRDNDLPERTDARQARTLDRAERDERRRNLLARRRPLVKETQQLERRIADLEAEKQQLDAKLSDPDLYANGETAGIAEASRRHRRISCELSLAEDRWLTVQAELEELSKP